MCCVEQTRWTESTPVIVDILDLSEQLSEANKECLSVFGLLSFLDSPRLDSVPRNKSQSFSGVFRNRTLHNHHSGRLHLHRWNASLFERVSVMNHSRLVIAATGLVLLFITACSDPIEANHQAATDAGTDADTRDANEDEDTGENRDTTRDSDTAPNSDVEESLDCTDRSSATTCGSSSSCSWFDELDCIDSSEVVAETDELPVPISGAHPGQAYIASHEILPDGPYETHLSVWDYNDQLTGSLYIRPINANPGFPLFAHPITGAVEDDGRVTLELHPPRCAEDSVEFEEECQALAEAPEEPFTSQGGFENYALDEDTRLSVFGAAELDADADEPDDRRPFIGMVLQPHGGFKPVNFSSNIDPRDTLSGTWQGHLQFIAEDPTLTIYSCELEIGDRVGASPGDPDQFILKSLACHRQGDESSELDVGTDTLRINATGDSFPEPFFSFQMTIDDQRMLASGIFWEGVVLSGVVHTLEADDDAALTHPSQIPEEDHVGVFALDIEPS